MASEAQVSSPKSSRPTSQPEAAVVGLEPAAGGWHCCHWYYEFDRGVLAELPAAELEEGRRVFCAALDPVADTAPRRVQTSITSGHKADFGVLLMDPHPLKIDAVHHSLMASPLGMALRSTYSYVSMTEISEYVPSPEQYGERLVREGEQPDSPAFQAKVKAYAGRLAGMNKQRLTPEIPPYPATCFYPMNKKRKVGENWFALEKTERDRMMSEHARSGMAFAGKVSQLITVSLGLDDWEWGVTLWGANPEYLKDIVYRMRFDEASARFAEFGPFYVGYVATPQQILAHCRIGG